MFLRPPKVQKQTSQASHAEPLRLLEYESGTLLLLAILSTHTAMLAPIFHWNFFSFGQIKHIKNKE